MKKLILVLLIFCSCATSKKVTVHPEKVTKEVRIENTVLALSLYLDWIFFLYLLKQNDVIK